MRGHPATPYDAALAIITPLTGLSTDELNIPGRKDKAGRSEAGGSRPYITLHHLDNEYITAVVVTHGVNNTYTTLLD